MEVLIKFEEDAESGSTLTVSFFDLKSDFGRFIWLEVLANVWKMTM